jgi:lysophospholipase L1-like esterase
MKDRSVFRSTVFVACFSMLTLMQACSDSQNGGGNGGASTDGGNIAGGGTTGSGGSAVPFGGRTGSGGARATGGYVGKGGSTGSGGAQASGGSIAVSAGGAGAGGLTRDAGRDVGSPDTFVPDAVPSDAGPAGVRLSGRIDMTDKTRPTFGWSGSAIYARFDGTGATVRMEGSTNQYQVVIDGNATSVLKFASGTTQYQVANSLSAGTHDLVIWKRTEGYNGNNSYVGLDVTGGKLLPASPVPDRRIELYGDSISAGYGLDGKYPCTASQDNENHYLTYAAIAARTLSAELHAIAWSGIGMYRNYDQPGPSSDAMPSVYAKTLAYETSASWDFSAWQPHAVVINLGTNDASTKGDPGTPYETAYLGFVRTLRQKYPDTFFVLSIGPMLDGDSLKAIRNHIQNVISTRASEGDSKMSYLEFPTQSTSDGLGCDSHPGPKTNAAMATQLVTELKTRLGW